MGLVVPRHVGSSWTRAQTRGCMYLFELWFPLGICPGVGLLDHMATLIYIYDPYGSYGNSQALCPNTVTLEIRASRHEFLVGEDTIQSIAELFTYDLYIFLNVCFNFKSVFSKVK